MNSQRMGFTLIEMLVVVAIIGILATTVVVAINPAHQLSKARDTERKTELVAILSSVLQYSSDHNGEWPDTDGDPATSNFPTTSTCIGSSVGCFNLAGAGESGDEIVPFYMVSMPTDPKTGTQQNTGYSIYVDANGRLHGSAAGEIENPITYSK